jgi:hypothetical protein
MFLDLDQGDEQTGAWSITMTRFYHIKGNAPGLRSQARGKTDLF